MDHGSGLRRVLIGSLLAAMLLVGCDSRRTPEPSVDGAGTAISTPTSMPTMASATPLATTIATATVTDTPTPSTAGVSCMNRDALPVIQIAMRPPMPRAGDRVTLTAEGLPPYVYSLNATDFDVINAFIGRLAVPPSGRLQATFVMPELPNGLCISIVANAGVGRPNRMSTAPSTSAYVFSGSMKLMPGRCEEVPRDSLLPTIPLSLKRMTSTPASPSPGATVTFATETPVNAAGPFTVLFALTGRFAWNIDGPLVADRDGRALVEGFDGDALSLSGGTVSATGIAEFSFVPPAHPAWSGRCVEALMMWKPHTPTTDLTWGYARFTYP